MRRMNISIAAALVVCLGTLGVSACSDERDTAKPKPAATAATQIPDGFNEIQAAVLRTLSEGSANVSFTSPASEGGSASTAELQMAGEIDFESGNAQLAVTGPSFRVVEDATEITTEMRVVDGVVYMDMSGIIADAAELLGDSEELRDIKWVKLDSSVIADDETSANPNVWLPIMAGLLAAEDVTTVGNEDIDGVSTTHYSAKLRIEGLVALLAKESASLPSILKDAAEQVEDVLGDGMDVDVWLDDDGRIVSAEYAKSATTATSVAGEEVPSAQSDATRFTVKFSDFGVTVKVEVPEGAIDFEDLAKRMGS